MSTNDDENLTYSIKLICLYRILNCSHARIIYAEVFEKMLSGGLEVSFSIILFKHFQTAVSRNHERSSSDKAYIFPI